MERITITHLRALAHRLNVITGSPETYSDKQPGGRFKANIGHYYISQTYGGYCLHRTGNDAGGVTCPLSNGHGPARDLYDQMHAYLRGLDDSTRVSAHDGSCPVCKSGNVTGRFIELETRSAFQPCTCTDCGASWNDTYTLTGYSELVKGGAA